LFQRLSGDNRRMPYAVAAIAVLAVATMAGCAVPGPRGAAPLTASAAVPPAFPVPGPRERMVMLARQEWALFGSPLVRIGVDGESRLEFPDPLATSHELQGPMLTRVLLYWYAVSRLPIVGADGGLRPWSAGFVSWLARSAGLAADDFPATVLHWDYIDRFMAGNRDDRFMTRDPARYAPRVGDLVCNARGATARDAGPRRALDFAQLRRGQYHCELVVEAGAGSIRTIGGNVGDAVALTALPVDEQGLLLAAPRRPWAAVLENRSP
jgi:hypothetical protein